VAWEPEHRARATALLQQFSAGTLDAAALRAALGAADRAGAPRASTRSTAVLRLYGVLTPGDSIFTLFGAGTSLRTFMSDLRAAAADPAITAIAVLVDSPGGPIVMVPEAAALMRTTRAKKPVVAAVSGFNASAAYWITSNATRIEATPSATIGAVGVYGQRISITRALAAEGVDVETFSAGRYKSEGIPTTPITDEERVAMQVNVEEAYTNFANDVSLGRGVSASTVRSGFAQGRTVSATEALRQRMIDHVALVEDTVARTAAGTIQARRSDLAWQNQVERELFELDLPSTSAPRRWVSADVRQQLELDRFTLDL
jgi:signal peptide peptidase SppA